MLITWNLDESKKDSEVTGYFHNFGTLEQVHCGHWLKRTLVPCNKRLALRWLGVLMTRSKFSPSSLYTALQLEQIVLKAREVMVLIMLNFWVLKFFKGIWQISMLRNIVLYWLQNNYTDTKMPHTSLKQHLHLLTAEAKRRLYYVKSRCERKVASPTERDRRSVGRVGENPGN